MCLLLYHKHQPSMDHFWDFEIPAVFQNFPINPCDLSVKQLMWIDELGGESGGFVGVWSNAVVLEIVSYFAQLDWKFNNLWFFFEATYGFQSNIQVDFFHLSLDFWAPSNCPENWSKQLPKDRTKQLHVTPQRNKARVLNFQCSSGTCVDVDT